MTSTLRSQSTVSTGNPSAGPVLIDIALIEISSLEKLYFSFQLVLTRTVVLISANFNSKNKRYIMSLPIFCYWPALYVIQFVNSFTGTPSILYHYNIL